MLAHDLRPELRWLSSGFLLMFCSGFGQTYFIAIFAGHLKSELVMTDGQFGSLYMLGTLCSASLLMWAGKLADKLSIRWLGAGVIAGLALTSLAMASVSSTWMLVVVLFALRFFGQGMMTQVAMTAMGRWFNRKRGRAVAVAGLGFPASEGLLPYIAVTLIGFAGWRMTWVVAAVALVVIAAPVLLALLKHERVPIAQAVPLEDTIVDAPRHEWTRGEVLGHPVFFALMPGVLAPPFIVTGIFFNQVQIVTIKGWDLSWFAASFPVLAIFSVFSGLAAGWLVDRFDARHMLPGLLILLGIATLLIANAASSLLLPVFMALVGVTLGLASTLQGTLWAELYGTLHLGAIRALAMAGMVFSTALSPALTGVLTDIGMALETQLLVMALYCFAAALGMLFLMPRLNRLAAG